MASDQVVVAQDVVRALMELRRVGNQPALEELEKLEPDLSEFLLEELTGVHHDLLRLGGKPPRARRLSRRVETLALVLVHALRHAHLRLWQDQSAGTLLEDMDPSPGREPTACEDAGPAEGPESEVA